MASRKLKVDEDIVLHVKLRTTEDVVEVLAHRGMTTRQQVTVLAANQIETWLDIEKAKLKDLKAKRERKADEEALAAAEAEAERLRKKLKVESEISGAGK